MTRTASGVCATAAALSLGFLASCDKAGPTGNAIAKGPEPSRTVFVQLFEWKWPDVARECEEFLGPAGYAAVQVSPPNEHVPGPEWWTRYQPVSYQLQSRGGTREQFADMVRRCRNAGVGIYADAVINHMSYVGIGTGVAGSGFAEYEYPVPYTYGDFHHCGRNGDDTIQNYQDLWEVQNCELVKLADLDTGKAAVQTKIADYLNDLLDLGVAGFRIDAAKHMAVDDVAGILNRLKTKAHVYQEVIDRGGEPINAHDYLKNGLVSEFKYPLVLLDAFTAGKLDGLNELSSRPGFLPPDAAVVFVDNHDIQRGHAGAGDVLNYKSGKIYELANVFMLAWPYGYPMVMSSYRFDGGDQGPPDSRPIDNNSGSCGEAWVCEHRLPSIAGMVRFRNATDGLAVSNWQALSSTAIAFGRGDRGFVIINIGAEPINPAIQSGMLPGEYCNAVTGCEGPRLEVRADGTLSTTLPPMSAVAIHSGTRTNRK
ncbi:MAG: alpha-amylase family protein [Gammaproteobacteria bacterium]|nr:alpha-amylase family protein [Gammaproteobacteria bacterium]MDH4313783.1 alpha-amylase family protein [Gammaproteobacteria bacterium]MDH5500042.1 alpha-amylase family protein [Gammaproteobacteria bacterium]